MVKDNLAADLAGLTRLHQLNGLLVDSAGLDSSLGHILALALEFTGMDRGAIQLLEEDTGRLHIAVHKGLSASFVDYFRFGACEAVSHQSAGDHDRVVIADVMEHPSLRETANLAVMLGEGIRSLQATALVSHRGKKVGMLSTAGPHPGIPPEDALRRLDLLAWIAGDFIERANAEQQLRRSEARLSAIFAEAEAGLSEISIDGKFRRVNDTLSRLLGRTKEELMNLGIEEVTAPEDLPRTFEALGRLKEFGKPVSLDKRYVRPDGTRVWANSTISLLELDSNQAPMILAVTIDLTERKQSEAALSESREHLQRVMESVRDHAIIILDTEGVITGWNPGAAAMFGYQAEEAVGQHSAMIFTPEDQMAGAPEKEMETARTSGHANDERWHLRKNGQRFWVSGVMSPLSDNGSLLGYVKVARDMTEQRLAEAAVRDSEVRFRTLADAVPQVVWTNDTEGYANYFNERWYAYTGLSEEESEGPGWQIIVHPDDAEASGERWKRSLERGEIFDTEYRLRNATGEYRWFIGRNIPLRNEQGEVTGWFGTATDVENMKRAEVALRQSEERLRIALESAEMGAWDWDVVGNAVTWNDRHYYLLGLQPDGQTKKAGFFLGFVHPEDKPIVTEKLREAVEIQGSFQAEFRIIRADNDELRWMTGYGRVMESAEGRSVRMTGVMFDSTQRKLTQEELRIAHDELESRVTLRTQELSDALERLKGEIAGRKELEEARLELLKRIVTTQEEERRRISRELHDNLGQHMVAVKLGLDRLEANRGDTSGEVPTASFEQLRQLVGVLIKAAHRQAWELRPAELDHLGLEIAVRHYIEDWSYRTDIDVQFQAESSVRLHPEIEIAFYRVIQESLTNVARHSFATDVKVVLATSPFPALTVEDNGRGFDPGITTGRLGMLGMKERLASLGGTFEVISAPGEGTKLVAKVENPLLVADGPAKGEPRHSQNTNEDLGP